jgi:thioredoxin 1
MDRPPIFADHSFATALEANKSSDSWLIVDATAQWCGPCKNMDRTTWRDAEVVAWLEAHATALQIDVDQEQEWAKAHRITAMPTLIAFKDGAEFDRVVGGRKPADLLDWLNGLQQGETAVAQLQRSVGEGDANVSGRLDLARALLTAGKLDEAAREFVWLWEHMDKLQPDMAGVRVSYVASEIETLVSQDESARSQFRAIRDRTAIEAAADPAGDARLDWIVLNEALGEQAATLNWFDHFAAAHPGRLALGAIANHLTPLLLSRDRWADAARLVDDGEQEIVRYHELLVGQVLPADWDEEIKQQFLAMGRDSLRRQAAEMRHILIAGDRNEEAAVVERTALSLDPSDEMKSWLAKPRDELLSPL